MTKPTTYKGSLVGIYFQDPLDPTQFIAPCGLSERNFQFTKGNSEVVVPDCDDPEAPSWNGTAVTSLSFSGSGSGLLAAEAVKTWWDFFNTTDSIPARCYVGAKADTVNGHYWEGNLHLTEFGVTGSRGELMQVSISVISDGEMVYNKVA